MDKDNIIFYLDNEFRDNADEEMSYKVISDRLEHFGVDYLKYVEDNNLIDLNNKKYMRFLRYIGYGSKNFNQIEINVEPINNHTEDCTKTIYSYKNKEYDESVMCAFKEI